MPFIRVKVKAIDSSLDNWKLTDKTVEADSVVAVERKSDGGFEGAPPFCEVRLSDGDAFIAWEGADEVLQRIEAHKTKKEAAVYNIHSGGHTSLSGNNAKITQGGGVWMWIGTSAGTLLLLLVLAKYLLK